MPTIEYGNSRADIEQLGAYISTLKIGSTEIFKKSNDGRQTHGGCAVLSPFANRVRNATYTFEGKQYVLPKNAGEHSIHGLLKDLIWNIESSGNASEISLSSRLNHPGYPSVLHSRLLYSISSDGFTVNYKATNAGTSNLPLMIGFHPYFLVGKEWSIDYKGTMRKLVYEDQFFPNGEMETVDLMSGNMNHSVFDNCFLFDGDIRLISSNATVLIRRFKMPYIVIYNGIFAEQISVAIEPMTGAPDAFNNHMGLLKLASGESFQCGFELMLE